MLTFHYCMTPLLATAETKRLMAVQEEVAKSAVADAQAREQAAKRRCDAILQETARQRQQQVGGQLAAWTCRHPSILRGLCVPAHVESMLGQLWGAHDATPPPPASFQSCTYLPAYLPTHSTPGVSARLSYAIYAQAEFVTVVLARVETMSDHLVEFQSAANMALVAAQEKQEKLLGSEWCGGWAGGGAGEAGEMLGSEWCGCAGCRWLLVRGQFCAGCRLPSVRRLGGGPEEAGEGAEQWVSLHRR